MKLRLVAAAAALMVLASCAEPEGETEPQPEQAESSTAPSEEAEPEPSRCIEVTPEFASFLGEQLVGGTSPGEAAAVKSEDYDTVWMVAVRLEGGAGGEAGVFATNADPTQTAIGQVFAADGYAQEFSDWPDGGDMIAPGSDGIDEALDCLS